MFYVLFYANYAANMTFASAPLLTTSRLMTRLATYKDVAKVVHYYQNNRVFLAPFEPVRSDEFFTEKFWRSQIERSLTEFNYHQSLRLVIFEQAPPQAIVGIINFTQFSRGASESCVVGYSLAESAQGKGYMSEALSAAIDYVFDELGFHRIMASYMPRNQRSGALLKKLGFTVEGYARDYLLINNQWEDHILTSLVNHNWSAR